MAFHFLRPRLSADPNSSIPVDKQLLAYELGGDYFLQFRYSGIILKEFWSLRKLYKTINELKENGYNIEYRSLPKNPFEIKEEQKIARQAWKQIKQELKKSKSNT